MAGNELQLYPDMQLTIPAHDMTATENSESFLRAESCTRFKERHLSFETLKTLLSPATLRCGHSHKRGYPSAGALYPIELFICSLSSCNKDWPCKEKVLHLLSKSRQFERVHDAMNIKDLKNALLPPGSDIGSPNIAIIYMAYLPKVLFKYRFRGYRMANMEVGSLYMLMDLSAKKIGLRNRVWSGYCDTMITQSLGLNSALFQPLCVQFFGHER